ncbi:MAG: CoA pyrophosphatase [Spirochaetota bacterium]
MLILIYPGASGPSIPLTLRRHDLNHHAGQVSFPGGTIEAGESAEEAAVREAREETGIDPTTISIIGSITPLRVTPSGFEIDPVLAWTAERPRFVLEAAEVSELIEFPLSALRDPSSIGTEEWEIKGGPSLVPFWKAGRHKVWGATAMILSELAELL